jgi:hypothetical protein
LHRAGASKGTGIIATSIIADIRRDSLALRGFAQVPGGEAPLAD